MKKTTFILAVATALIMSLGSAGCSSSKGAAGYTTRDSIANLSAKRLFADQQFVMTADRVTIGNSPSISVTRYTNFVLVNGSSGIVQISPAVGGGPNGVGGVTAQGNVSGYNVTEGSRGESVVTFRLNSNMGSADVRIVLNRYSNEATAFVSGTFSRGRATMTGVVDPLPKSMVTGVGPALPPR